MNSFDRKGVDFVPVDRATPEVLDAQIENLKQRKTLLLQNFVDIIPDLFLLLNENRQIVFANKACLDYAGRTGKSPYGLRVGEFFDCVNAAGHGDGCEGTGFCRYCGVPNVGIDAQLTGQSTRDIRILLKNPPGEVLEFKVWGSTVEIGDVTYIAFAFRDISHEKRRHALERIFFHDVMNIASELHSLSELFKMGRVKDVDQMIHMFANGAEALLDEIRAQRQLTDAERDELETVFQDLDSKIVVEKIASLFQRRKIAENKTIEVEPDFEQVLFNSEATILSRIIGNMVKNALEAIGEKQKVGIGCRQAGKKVLFSVHNPGTIPEDVQKHIFKRSFSTKGLGRGIGTYGIRLLTEKYLRGRVFFSSGEKEGTTFNVEIPVSPEKEAGKEKKRETSHV